MEKTGKSKLLTSGLKRTSDEVETAVSDVGYVNKLVILNARNEAVKLALVYLREAWALMGPSFIEFVASLTKQNGVLASGSDGICKRVISDGTLEKMTEEFRLELDVRPTDGVGDRVVLDGSVEKRNEDCRVELHERPCGGVCGEVVLDAVGKERNNEYCSVGLDVRPTDDGVGERVISVGIAEERNEDCRVELDVRPTCGFEAQEMDVVCSPYQNQYSGLKESVELTEKSTHGDEQKLVNDMACDTVGAAAVISDNEGRDLVVNASPALIDKEIVGGNVVLQRKHGPSHKCPRPRGSPKIIDSDDLSRDTSSGKFNYLPIHEDDKIQEALRSSSLELHASVRDLLPETVTLYFASKSANNEALMENLNVNQENERNSTLDTTNHPVRSSDANVGIPSKQYSTSQINGM